MKIIFSFFNISSRRTGAHINGAVVVHDIIVVAVFNLDGVAVEVGNQLRTVEYLLGVIFLAIQLDIFTPSMASAWRLSWIISTTFSKKKKTPAAFIGLHADIFLSGLGEAFVF